MPRNTIGDPPFPPVVVIDTKDLFTLSDLEQVVAQRPKGASICIRYADGPIERGGYFFHFCLAKQPPQHLSLYDFEKRHVVDLSPEALVAFINHCTGRKFDEASFVLCQTELNFLKDE